MEAWQGTQPDREGGREGGRFFLPRKRGEITRCLQVSTTRKFGSGKERSVQSWESEGIYGESIRNYIAGHELILDSS